MKVIFLDVDGVLHCADSRENFFEPNCMAVLHQVVAMTGACIVLSSNWRRSRIARKRVSEELGKIDAKMISQTPNLQGVGSDEATRSMEILQWVKGNPDCESWVAVDDMDLTDSRTVPEKVRRGMQRRFVHTHWQEGLAKKHMYQLIGILSVKIEPPLRTIKTKSDVRRSWMNRLRLGNVANG